MRCLIRPRPRSTAIAQPFPPSSAVTALPLLLLRHAISCLLLAVADAAFARRAASELSLLEEAQIRLRWLRLRPGRGRDRSDADWIREMAGKREG